MKKDKQKAQQKANRKKAEKAVKAALITELSKLIGSFAEPNKKLKKLIEKASSAFAKEIEKTAKPLVATEQITTEETTTIVEEKKSSKPRATKKTEKAATK